MLVDAICCAQANVDTARGNIEVETDHPVIEEQPLNGQGV
jgi:hypothetical protein